MVRVVIRIRAALDLVSKRQQAWGELPVMGQEPRLGRGPRPHVIDLSGHRGHERDVEVVARAARRAEAGLDPADLLADHVRLGRPHHDRAVSLSSGELAHPLLADREMDRDALVEVGAKKPDRLLDLGYLLWLQPNAVEGRVTRPEAEDRPAMRDLRHC